MANDKPQDEDPENKDIPAEDDDSESSESEDRGLFLRMLGFFKRADDKKKKTKKLTPREQRQAARESASRQQKRPDFQTGSDAPQDPKKPDGAFKTVVQTSSTDKPKPPADIHPDLMKTRDDSAGERPENNVKPRRASSERWSRQSKPTKPSEPAWKTTPAPKQQPVNPFLIPTTAPAESIDDSLITPINKDAEPEDDFNDITNMPRGFSDEFDRLAAQLPEVKQDELTIEPPRNTVKLDPKKLDERELTEPVQPTSETVKISTVEISKDPEPDPTPEPRAATEVVRMDLPPVAGTHTPTLKQTAPTPLVPDAVESPQAKDSDDDSEIVTSTDKAPATVEKSASEPAENIKLEEAEAAEVAKVKAEAETDIKADEEPAPDIMANLSELPLAYQTHTTTLAIVDPERVLLHWDLDPARIPTAGSVMFFLQTKGEEPETASSWHTIEHVPLGRQFFGDYYIATEPGTEYRVLLGYQLNREFHPQLTSNEVTTPEIKPRFAEFSVWKRKQKKVVQSPVSPVLKIEEDWEPDPGARPLEPAPLAPESKPLNTMPNAPFSDVELSLPEVPDETPVAEDLVFDDYQAWSPNRLLENAEEQASASSDEWTVLGKTRMSSVSPEMTNNQSIFLSQSDLAEFTGEAELEADDWSWNDWDLIDEADQRWRLVGSRVEGAEEFFEFERVSSATPVETLVLPTIRWFGSSDFGLIPGQIPLADSEAPERKLWPVPRLSGPVLQPQAASIQLPLRRVSRNQI